MADVITDCPREVKGVSTLERAPSEAQHSLGMDLASTASRWTNRTDELLDGGTARLRTRRPVPGSAHLRAVLVALDLVGIATTWTIAGLVATSDADPPASRAAAVAVFVLVVVVAALVALGAERLYLTRVCAARSVEFTRLTHVAICAGVAAIVVGPAVGIEVSVRLALAAGTVMVCVLAGFRDTYTVWLRSCRTRGRFCRDLVIVGTGTEASNLCHLLTIQPELGYRVRGIVGNRTEWRRNVSEFPWLGDLSEAAAVTRRLDAGALVSVTSVSADDLNRIVRELLAAGIHVHTSTGMLRMGRHRLRAVPMSHETLFYVETGSRAAWQFAVKRAIDVSAATILLVLTAPVLVFAAICIKLQDGGSVLFKQERVGQHGHPFQVLKLRTMVPDAAHHLDDIKERNEREDGPLFKVTNDPRVTRAGKFLRATSIDELPQLLNVIRGQMSLVGPRPALPSEVAKFDAEHLARQRVRPGVTGLWQIEGRDNPSFSIYRRLDLFYVENWSLRLDAAILARTVSSVAGRAVRALTGSSTMQTSEPTVPAVSDAGALR
jgi:exopolysaccharide biosynthesis polyprenyl glycosylphosphotransferase